ncbi:transcriptional regulator [Paenibacillus sp.]|uniref:helix-turn-helix transcriptional regulator n=1 Tax=Paenibacillus sp. TaxID=58172 RepID=UPI002D5B9908|nr:transcriptional regulator [Paenibacillus sp.]HZG87852.1 transcriptional regulator [Paenibacillus sp.]
MRLITLIQGKPGILARELAERCDTTERTIYRDLEALSAMNVPVSNLGHGKGYAFVGNFSLYPLDWTDEETLAFTMLPSILEHVQQLLPPGFSSAYEKVMAANRKEKAKRRDTIEDIADIIQTGTPSHRDDAQHHLFAIMQAALSQKTVEATYFTLSRNETKERKIDPYYLVPREQRFYLIGYCHSAQEIRTFRLSRFRRVSLTEQSFDKGDFNIRQYMKHTWSIERGDELITFKVKFAPNVARYIREEELFVRPKLTEMPDGGLLFEVTVNHDREFLGWLSQYGPDAEIVEPQSYREQMRERLERWQAIYAR